MFRELRRLVKEECCNYAAIGSFGRKDYCFLEPKDDCQIFRDRPCLWFQKAVLPLKPDYIGFYKQLLEQANPNQVDSEPISTRIKQCACGAAF